MTMIDLKSDSVRLSVNPQTDEWIFTDLRSKTEWRKSESSPWIWEIGREADKVQETPLIPEGVHAKDGSIRHLFKIPSQIDGRMEVVFRIHDELLSIYLNPLGRIVLPEIELAPDFFQSSAMESGFLVAPCRMGLYIPAQGDSSFQHLFGTYDYEGCHMAMIGLLKRNGGLMATWSDPNITVNVSRRVEQNASWIKAGFLLSRSARSLGIASLPDGEISSLATAYRRVARDKGYAVTFEEKSKRTPQVERLFGACNFKLWTALDRRVDENLREKSVTVHWTFDEAARIAEHLKNDLKLEDVLFHLGGWTRYGYDCRHPDIMPPNPECGGEKGLKECAQRVQQLGYLFCLHDNYQDMYRDAPSWNENAIQKKRDGDMTLGGVWLGGRAYITCSKEAFKLASRPQNLQSVRDTIRPDLYFIDTTYAAGLQECFDPMHALTKQDDMYWKQRLSFYARELFGMFGSECGREWAIPCADFFEGLVSVGGKYYHQLIPDELGASVIPFFDMVYRDCIALYGKYGYNPSEMAELTLHHVSCARPMYYHHVSDHLYWESDSKEENPWADGQPDYAIFTRAHNGWAEGMCEMDRFMKNTHEILGPMHKLTAKTNITSFEFLDSSRKVRTTHFADLLHVTVNGDSAPFPLKSVMGGDVVLPRYGFLAEGPSFIAFLATQWAGREYDSPVLFTFRSLDGLPLSRSMQVRVFHGFGDDRLNWDGHTVSCRTETILPVTTV